MNARERGRLVVVTGGSKGIGREIVARFMANGDSVVAVARDEAALAGLEADLPSVATRVCDITSEECVDAAFRELDAVDVLVNNAGFAESAPLERTTLASWRAHLDTNATGPFLCTRAVIGAMRERGRGSIVTVASTAGRVGTRYTTAYTASKHAAIGLMRVAAAELAGSGATANALCPTYVDTPMTQRSAENIATRTGRTKAESLGLLADASPLARLLAPAEVAAAVLWLASPEASSINGQALVLDGGGLQA